MSLPAPNLDDRKFQQIVDDTKRQIGQRCREWTDHNVSDPGVTLLELFASMTEMTLYRLNQVPERNYIKFLEMLGIGLLPPTPARTDLHFYLTAPLDDDGSGPQIGVSPALAARTTIAATMRSENEEAIEFATDVDANFDRPKLAFAFALGREQAGEVQPGAERLGALRDLRAHLQALAAMTPEESVQVPEGFALWGGANAEQLSANGGAPTDKPRQDDAFYLGFEGEVEGALLGVEVESIQASATSKAADFPSQLWEVWGEDGFWVPLEVVSDGTQGFNAPRGSVVVAIPRGVSKRMLLGVSAFWIRCRYTLDPQDVPPREVVGPRGETTLVSPTPYQHSPRITSLNVQTVGAQVPSSACRTIFEEEVGLSDGMPGQVFTPREKPVLPRVGGETVWIGTPGDAANGGERWTEVSNFAASGPDDLHFVWDDQSGEIFLGPNIVAPDGKPRQHGRVPPRGQMLRISRYRVGGGTVGNVRAGAVCISKNSPAYIAGVINPRPARGGRDSETLEHAKMRAQQLLRVRERAVTSEDYEFLACQASPAIARVQCLQPSEIGVARELNIEPGHVSLLLVPQLAPNCTTPRPADLRVSDLVKETVRLELDSRRLLGTSLDLKQPDYVWVSTAISLVVQPSFDPLEVARHVRERLEAFIHPTTGGSHGRGWNFGSTLSVADIYAQIGALRGVAFLRDLKIYRSDVRASGDLGAEKIVRGGQGLAIGAHQTLCSREHRIEARALTGVSNWGGTSDG